MTGTVYTSLHTNQSRSYLNHLVHDLLNYRTNVFKVDIFGKLMIRY